MRRRPSRNSQLLPGGISSPEISFASAGLGSRRQCEELIRTGRITIDGLPIDNPGINVNPLKQVVEYDGERLAGTSQVFCAQQAAEGSVVHEPRSGGSSASVIDLFQKERCVYFRDDSTRKAKG
ncbi:MAG: S4 domain-containing protein [Planctomycetaceae bacterium]